MAAIDKVPLLKNLLINKYSNLIRLAQSGYPVKDYHDIREAMLAINMFDNFAVDQYFEGAIIEYYLRKLNELQ